MFRKSSVRNSDGQRSSVAISFHAVSFSPVMACLAAYCPVLGIFISLEFVVVLGRSFCKAALPALSLVDVNLGNNGTQVPRIRWK
ncbi:hypothetical protein EJB05_36526 [Eragrostis curvula]|uniref:Uncharacterized protein n=1 Tax=Eragrostis curvula TaxID=38414 RepID=A0A5J9UAV4_9POAL|nr:hypothetical protein EJB05_36526 [Eragrostis curvula]